MDQRWTVPWKGGTKPASPPPELPDPKTHRETHREHEHRSRGPRQSISPWETWTSRGALQWWGERRSAQALYQGGTFSSGKTKATPHPDTGNIPEHKPRAKGLWALREALGGTGKQRDMMRQHPDASLLPASTAVCGGGVAKGGPRESGWGGGTPA